MSGLTDTLLLTCHMTANEKYLEPVFSMAQARLDNRGADAEPGSLGWCVGRMGFLNGTLAKYRILTGDDRFDTLLGRGSSYLHYRQTEDKEPLVEALTSSAIAFSHNFERYTSEVRYTDRVLRFPAVFQGDVVLAEPRFEVRSPQPDLIYSTVTGDPGSVGYFPMNAVRWLTPARDIAALVTDCGPDRLQAELFHFGDEPRAMGAELYLLEPGEYELTVEIIDDPRTPLYSRETFEVTGPRARVEFELPAGRLCHVTALR